MLASTYLGGYDNDAVVEGSSINLDSSGNIYVIGQTQSSNFPTTSGVYDTSYNGSYDTFIAKLDSSLSATPSDTTAPIGSISINSGALYTNSTTVTLNLSATDTTGVIGYYLSDSSTTPSSSASGWTSVTSTTSYSGSVSYTLSSGEGSKTIYAWYKDAAGNVSSTVNATITFDTTAPTVTISSPTSSSTYTATSSTISLGGSASDSSSGISSVAWSNDKGGNGTATGTASWTASSISLSSGDNIITVTAKDGAGNSGTDTITVSVPTVSTPSPTITPIPTPTPTPVPATPTPFPSTPTPVSVTPTPTPTPRTTATPTPTPCEKPRSEFQADKLSILEGVSVQFTDLSTGEPKSWLWDFGDGSRFEDTRNPTHVYAKAGKYDVTLTVSNACGEDTEKKLKLIEVLSTSVKPAADFSADPTSGIVPLTVTFQDRSTGVPTSWFWKFGDGGNSAEQNPIHEYKASNVFTPRLTVSNDKGQNTIEKTNLITVIALAEPVAEFNASPTAGFAPLDVQFNNLSTGNPTSFAWKFGDGGSSGEESPKHTYKSSGIFTPSLLASNSAGADTETKTNLINVQSGEPPSADFNASPLAGFAPLRVQFTDISAGNVANWTWNLGDGVTSSLQNPAHDYLNAGFYNVRLIVSGADGSGEKNKVNLINILEGEGPTAAFLAEPITGNAPFTVHFFDQSSGEIANQTWEFGDGGNSTEQNPAHTYKNTGSFNVKLTVSGKNGTSVETKTGLVEVKEGKTPTAGFAAEGGQGAGIGDNGLNGLNGLNDLNGLNGLSEPPGELTVRFKDLSSTPVGEIISREWSFGDGAKNEEKEPEHTYKGSEGDTFTVSLIVRNADGLDTITKPAFVSIKTSIIPGFVKGKVTDNGTGDVISGVAIAINSVDKVIANVETTDDGLYFMQIPSGDYDITAAKEGFSDFSKKINIKQSETLTVDIGLRRGGGGHDEGEEGVAALTAAPETAPSSLRKQTAVVTAMDEDGNPLSGVVITAKASGKGASVSPLSNKTDKDGEAVFKFRFGFSGKDGKITFTADGLETVIEQE